jgi:hypothetical protein
MNRLFSTTIVETSGVRTIAGGGTNASNAGQALLNLSGVSITGDQTVGGQKTFSSQSTVFGAGNNGEIIIADDLFGGELGIITSNDEVLAIKFNDGSFCYGGGNPGSEPLRILNNIANFTERLKVNGTGILLSGEAVLKIEQNKSFVFRPTLTGNGNSNSTIAYGANCTLIPKYVGTVRADASISMTCIGATSVDVQQAATFWYGTGTAPVYSGNLVSLNGNRIGGLKSFHALSQGTQNTIYPVSASWIAEITGLITGTEYWFDIGISGNRMRVQDVQLYIEEKY